MRFQIGQRTPVFEATGGGSGGAETGGAAHPVEAPWAAAGADTWKLGEGETAQPWYTTIPEEAARQHVETKGYKNPAELALANYNLTRLQRGDPTVIGLPGEGATPEDMDAFYAKLGRPETPEGYKLKFAEGTTVDDATLQFGRSAFHKAGLTPQQAQVMAEEWNTFQTAQMSEMQQQVAQANDAELEALKGRWSGDLDKNLEAGRRAVQALGLDNALIERVEGAIGTAAVVELMAVIGRKSDEGGFKAGSQSGDPNDPSSMTKPQVAARIQQLQGDAEFMARYTDKNHPNHKDALRTMERLFAAS